MKCLEQSLKKNEIVVSGAKYLRFILLYDQRRSIYTLMSPCGQVHQEDNEL